MGGICAHFLCFSTDFSEIFSISFFSTGSLNDTVRSDLPPLHIRVGYLKVFVDPLHGGSYIVDLYFYDVLMLINVGFEVLTLPKPAQNQDIDSTMSPKS